MTFPRRSQRPSHRNRIWLHRRSPSHCLRPHLHSTSSPRWVASDFPGSKSRCSANLQKGKCPCENRHRKESAPLLPPLRHHRSHLFLLRRRQPHHPLLGPFQVPRKMTPCSNLESWMQSAPRRYHITPKSPHQEQATEKEKAILASRLLRNGERRKRRRRNPSPRKRRRRRNRGHRRSCRPKKLLQKKKRRIA